MDKVVMILIVVILAIIFVMGMDFVVALAYAISYRKKHGDMHRATRHRKIMKSNVYKVLIVVLLAEALVQIVGVRGLGLLFWVHLVFAVPFLLSFFALVFWITGFHAPSLHRILGYSCLVFFLGTTATGIPLLFRLIQR